MSGEPFAPDDRKRPSLRDLIWASIFESPSGMFDTPLIRVWVTAAEIIALIAASVLVSAIVVMVIAKLGQLFRILVGVSHEHLYPPPETELYQETYGVRWFDDPELAQVFYPDEARTDQLVADAVRCAVCGTPTQLERNPDGTKCAVYCPNIECSEYDEPIFFDALPPLIAEPDADRLQRLLDEDVALDLAALEASYRFPSADAAIAYLTDEDNDPARHGGEPVVLPDADGWLESNAARDYLAQTEE
jgi:hypothetical protein